MRGIKFRVWWAQEDGKGGKMYADPKISFTHLNSVFEEMKDIWIFMQFTGLLDKHGKEIYEGDILAKGEPERYYGIVKFNNGSYVADMYRYKELETENHSIAGLITYSYEIIGNIYENSDLLK